MKKSVLKGSLNVIAAPSGAGKSTLIKRLKKDFPEILESISYTTRPPRKGEIDGVHYFFIDKLKFKKMIEDGAFLEWAEVHSQYYGTSKKFIEDSFASGKHLLFDFDVQGADSLKKYFGDRINVIYIAPPSLEVLEKRLRARDTDHPDVIAERLKNASKEILRKDDYDYCIINEDIDIAYNLLKQILIKSVGRRVS